MQEQRFPFEPPIQEPTAYAVGVAERRRAFFRVGVALAALLVVTVVMQYVTLFAVTGLFPSAAEAWWLNWVLSLIPLYGFGLPAFWLSMKGLARGGRSETYVSRREILCKPRFRFEDFVLLAVVGFGLLYIGNFIGTLLMSVLSSLTEYDYENALASVLDGSPTWMVVLGTVVIAPIGEEFIFRKLLMDRLLPFGDASAILVSAAAFGLFHGNFFQFFYAFLVGVVLAYMYAWSGNWLWGVGLHMLINLVGGVIMPYVIGLLDLEMEFVVDPARILDYLLILGIEMLILALISGAIGILIFLFCSRRIYLGRGNGVPLTLEDSAVASLGNPGIILAAVLFVAYMALSLLPVS